MNIVLKEYEYLQYTKEDEKNYIPKDTFEALERFVLKNQDIAQYLIIAFKKGYGKVLQAKNFVGVIQTKDKITIEILPKVNNVSNEELKEILIRMLKSLKKSPFKNFNMAHLKSSKMPLLEIFISMFLDELTKLIQKGLKSDYITKEENLKFLKGKLNIKEQIKQNYIHKERFFVEYQEFLLNRIENKLIKTTLKYLYKKSKLNKNQQRIREYLFILDEVDLSFNIKNDFSKIKLNRQTKEYESILLWCRVFLLNRSFTPYKGDDIAFALLFDMNLLFESYVYEYLKKYGKYKNITSQDRGYYLAYLNGKIPKFKLKPDIVINKDSNNVIIADTKWKILSKEKLNQGVNQADMYQMFAYGNKYKNCKKIYLIYPYEKIEEGNFYKYSQDQDGLELKVLFFDISKPHKQQHFKLEDTYS